jgi:Transglycosylase-like domain
MAHAATAESPVPARVVTTDSVTMQAAPHELYRAAQVRTYTLRPGDSLFKVAREFCGNGDLWPATWHATGGIADPNLVPVGLKVTVACSGDMKGYDPPAPVSLTSHVAQGNSGGKTWGVSYGYPNFCGDGDGDGWDVSCQQAAPDPQPAHQQPQYVAAASYSGGGGMQSCIIGRESGGNSQVMNATGHYGLYQFAYQTWVDNGGSPGSFGHASVAEQNQVYYNDVARHGYSDWAAYDGC